MRPKLYKRVRFLALRWDVPHWGTQPTILLYPFIRFWEESPSLEHVIQEGQIEYALCAEKKEPCFSHTAFGRRHKAVVPYLKKVAKEMLRGKKFPRKNYRLMEIHCEFTLDRRGDAEWDNESKVEKP